MLKESVGNVCSGAEGLRGAGSCWRGCWGGLHHDLVHPFLLSEAIWGCECALEGEPGPGQEWRTGSSTAVNVELQQDQCFFWLCRVPPSQQATYALLALAWVFVPVYISSGVRIAALSLLWGAWPQPGPLLPGGLSPLSFETPKPCSGNTAIPLPSLGLSLEEGAWTGQRSLSFPLSDCHDARVSPAKVWR